MRKRDGRAKESGKEIGTRAGRGIDIDVPGGDGDGTKGGRESRRSSGGGGRGQRRGRPRHKYAEN